MQRHLLSLLLALVVASSMAQEHPTASGLPVNGTMQMPRFLQPGDRVAIISPCSATDSATVIGGCRTLADWGYQPVLGKHVLAEHHGFAGTADERAADLLWALRDTTVRAILCTRGGDGAVQLLSRVPLSAFTSHPKWLIGFSDVTALHSAAVSAGVMSIHGSMCHAISSMQGTDTVSQALRRLLAGKLPHYRVAHHELDQPGTATGMLVGGNLSVFCALAGSHVDFLNRPEPLILFIEDTGESMTKVDRLLHQLEIRGILGRLRGIIVGRFSDYRHPENGFDDMYYMLHYYLQHYAIPVAYAFPVGHARLNNFPMIEGATVRLTVGTDGTSLQFLSP